MPSVAKSTRACASCSRSSLSISAASWRFSATFAKRVCATSTYGERLDAPGRPAAHVDYLKSHDGLVGNIPNEDWRWRRRHNYYLNCLGDVDRNIVSLLDEL